MGFFDRDNYPAESFKIGEETGELLETLIVKYKDDPRKISAVAGSAITMGVQVLKAFQMPRDKLIEFVLEIYDTPITKLLALHEKHKP